MRELLCNIYVIYSTVGPLNMFGSTSTQSDTAQRVVKYHAIDDLNPPRSPGGPRSTEGGCGPVKGHNMVSCESASAPETFTEDPPARRYGRIVRSALKKISHFLDVKTGP